MSEIHRAVSDKSAKDLLGHSFRRQLFMDGHYDMVTFVCTKADSSLQITEICRYVMYIQKKSIFIHFLFCSLQPVDVSARKVRHFAGRARKAEGAKAGISE